MYMIRPPTIEATASTPTTTPIAIPTLLGPPPPLLPLLTPLLAALALAVADAVTMIVDCTAWVDVEADDEEELEVVELGAVWTSPVNPVR